MGNSKEISLNTSIFPIIFLVSMLVYNIFNNEWLGAYTFHIILLTTAAIVTITGLINKVTLKEILIKIYKSVKSIKTPIIILLLVGALAGTWKVSGVIPAMVYYGINFIRSNNFSSPNPSNYSDCFIDCRKLIHNFRDNWSCISFCR